MCSGALAAAKGARFGGDREDRLYDCLNRGIVLIPVVNRTLTGPDTTFDDRDRRVRLWDETRAPRYGK